MSTEDGTDNVQNNEAALKDVEHINSSENTDKMGGHGNVVNSSNIPAPALEPVLPLVNSASENTALELPKDKSKNMDTTSQVDNKESPNVHNVVEGTERETEGKNTHTVPDSICSGENLEYEESKSEDVVKEQSVETGTKTPEINIATTESKDDNTEDGSDDDDSDDDDDESSTQDDDGDDDVSESDTEEEESGEDESSGDDDDDDEDEEGSSIPETCTEENTEDSDTQGENDNENEIQGAGTSNDTSGGTMHCEASGNTGSEIQ